MSEVSKKVEFIIAWYNKEKDRFSFTNQVMLAKTWIDICTRNEEYEMAAALQKEKEKVIEEFLKKKRESRTCKDKILYHILMFRRKFIRKRGD
jgi:hypothetical protein